MYCKRAVFIFICLATITIIQLYLFYEIRIHSHQSRGRMEERAEKLESIDQQLKILEESI